MENKIENVETVENVNPVVAIAVKNTDSKELPDSVSDSDFQSAIDTLRKAKGAGKCLDRVFIKCACRCLTHLKKLQGTTALIKTEQAIEPFLTVLKDTLIGANYRTALASAIDTRLKIHIAHTAPYEWKSEYIDCTTVMNKIRYNQRQWDKGKFITLVNEEDKKRNPDYGSKKQVTARNRIETRIQNLVKDTIKDKLSTEDDRNLVYFFNEVINNPSQLLPKAGYLVIDSITREAVVLTESQLKETISRYNLKVAK